jgi:hypothetical protein
MMAADTTTRANALAAYDAGLCPIPIRSDGSKKPVVSWKQYQDERPTRTQVEEWFGPHQAVAVICGAVSGGLVMVEMEGQFFEEGLWQQFRAAVVERIGEERWQEICAYVEQSPSGGPHIYMRCPGFSDGNEKLAKAMRPNPVTGVVEPIDIMETRGEGGYSIIAGSTGHATGNEWVIAKGGSIAEITTVTRDELDAILDAARTLDELPEPEELEPPRPNGTRTHTGDSWMDATVGAYNGRHPVLEELPGWSPFKVENYRGEQVQRLHREGSDNDHGATIYPSGRVGFFSSNAPPGCRSWDGKSGHIPTYDAFTLALLAAGKRDHPDDRVAFALELRRRGYGPSLDEPRATSAPARAEPEPIVAEPDAPFILPTEFWEARPSLAHIRQAAHSRIRSADLVFHGVLARLSAYTPHIFELPALAGAAGSLNYFTIAVGPSGAGKSSGSAIADELLPRPPKVEDKPLGSGEGLAENYMGTVTEEGPDGKKKQVRRQVLHNVFVYGDEGAALTEMMQRKGATLPEALRRAWTGGALGQSNATTERTRVIPAGNYRLGLLIGFQPEVAAMLMADAIAGTPQRFTFAWAGDPNIPDVDAIPDWPGQLEVPTPTEADRKAHTVMRGGYRRVQLSVAEEIRTEVVGDAVRRARGTHEGAALDSHEPLHLLKIAGLLALLEGRLHIRVDDWELARTVWVTSRAVRAVVEHRVAAERDRQDSARIDFHARREGAAEAARGSARDSVLRISRNLAAWVHEHPDDEGYTKAQLGRRIAGRERHLLDAVVSHCLSREWMAGADSGRLTAGPRSPQEDPT